METKKNKDSEKVDILGDEPVIDANENEKKGKKLHDDAELETLRSENKKLLDEKNELNTKYLMSIADMQNYKKRLDLEQANYMKYSTFDMAQELIKVLDSFDLAIEKDQEDEKIKAYLEGFKMIRASIFNILEKEGVKEVEALGKPYDPSNMTSVMMNEDKSKKDQEVLHVLLKGYMYKDRVLRSAHVIINDVKETETVVNPEVKEKNNI